MAAVELGSDYDLFSKKPSAKTSSRADENLTYCSKTSWDIDKSLLQLSQSWTLNSVFFPT